MGNACSCIESHSENKNELSYDEEDADKYGTIDGQYCMSSFSNSGITTNKKLHGQNLLSSRDQSRQGGKKSDVFYTAQDLEERNCVLLPNDITYSGQWKGGVKQGRGSLTRPDGSKFVGTFVNDRVEGYGCFTHPNGDVYEGQWKGDKANGFGTLKNEINKTGYRGQWLNDLRDGYGTEKHADGSEYEGLYEKDMKHGEGTFLWSDGSYYKGNFVYDKIEGQGVHKWPSEQRTYEGQWINNHMEGFGIMTMSNKQYIGEMKNDEFSGLGLMIYNDTNKYYAGYWRRNQRHGLGKLFNEKSTNYFIYLDSAMVKRVSPIPENVNHFEQILLDFLQHHVFNNKGTFNTLLDSTIDKIAEITSSGMLTCETTASSGERLPPKSTIIDRTENGARLSTDCQPVNRGHSIFDQKSNFLSTRLAVLGKLKTKF